jgi:hypothetical protein
MECATVVAFHFSAVIAERFAQALDNEDYALAQSFLSDACVYLCRGEWYEGPTAIIASYRGNGTAARVFDSIEYQSDVAPGPAGNYRIRFTDHIEHTGRRFSFRCEQIVEIDEQDRIIRIEHHDLPGQLEALAAFRRLAGVPKHDAE